MDPYLYLDRDTFVHRLDPRTKIFLLIGAFVLAFTFVAPLYELAILGVMLLFAYVSGAFANLRRIWFILIVIAVMTVIMWSLSGLTTAIQRFLCGCTSSIPADAEQRHRSREQIDYNDEIPLTEAPPQPTPMLSADQSKLSYRK